VVLVPRYGVIARREEMQTRTRKQQEQDRGLRYAAWVRIGFRCGVGRRLGREERTPLTPTPPRHTELDALLTILPVRALALPHPSLRSRPM
jgi:hypothetical protein